jgi:hypothetical protein
MARASIETWKARCGTGSLHISPLAHTFSLPSFKHQQPKSVRNWIAVDTQQFYETDQHQRDANR